MDDFVLFVSKPNTSKNGFVPSHSIHPTKHMLSFSPVFGWTCWLGWMRSRGRGARWSCCRCWLFSHASPALPLAGEEASSLAEEEAPSSLPPHVACAAACQKRSTAARRKRSPFVSSEMKPFDILTPLCQQYVCPSSIFCLSSFNSE